MILLKQDHHFVSGSSPLSVEQFIENMKEGVIVTNPNGDIETINTIFTEITGYEKKDVVGQNPRILHSGRQGRKFYKSMWDILQSKGSWQGEIWNRKKNGEIYPEWLTISTIKNENGEISHYMGVFSDISSRKVSEEMLSKLAYHDALTGLPNRELLRDRLNQSIAQAQRNHKNIAILFIDLDGFKPINDTYGHHIGDSLLKIVASRLKGCIRKGDTLARLGGDEFVIVLSNYISQQGIVRASNEILKTIAQPFRLIKAKDFLLTASIGISLYPTDGQDVSLLIRNADTAMYKAKNTGRNKFVFFREESSNDTEIFIDPGTIITPRITR